ncbi:paraquat-inducible protein A [Nitrosomonas sp. Nm84]|uniref:paraquat-inducible protein A n=1 Tax=Nitrosomonas sp. Nm84 TaxID=200124 RepID=UPI000D9AE104|nr:paraquat-inducible protein A [Nitrosomonas sp. Nm84]PXW84944.1 paraquat-inducible protein A [Nitrosomonas sp. Nm84]
MTGFVSLMACHECDLLLRVDHSFEEGVVKCPRCAAVLLKHKRHSLDLTLAYTMAGLILFAISNVFPIIGFQFERQSTETILLSGVQELLDQNMRLLAGLVFITTILAPFTLLVTLLYVFLPLKFNRIAPYTAEVFRFTSALRPWSMMEVFMLGILVSVVKLVAIATIIPGVALWSFGILIFVLAATTSSLDPDLVWEKLELTHERSN